MNPVVATRQRYGLYLLAWLPVALLLGGILSFVGAYPLLTGLLLVGPLTIVYALVCQGSYYLCRARPLHLAVLHSLIATHLVAGALSASLWVILGGWWVTLLEALGVLEHGAEGYTRASPILFGAGLLLYLLCSALFYVAISYEASREAERSALEFRVLSRDAELKALRAQIHPHFLFNSLNSISALVTRDPEGARRLCVLLADFLRQSLTLGGRELVPLSEELALAEKLLSIERVRFGARLRVRVEAEAGAGECLLPPLLLQPLVENAVTHGIAHLLEGGEVSVSAALRDERLILVVKNPRDPEAPRSRGAGLGLENVQKRVLAFYGADGETQVRRGGRDFEVELRLPVRAP